MTQATGTHSRFDLQTKGENVREDLADMITMISPTLTPLQSMARDMKASNTFKEWLKDSLAAASTSNAHIDGDEFSGDTLTAPARLSNYLQILRKDLIVSRRARKVNQAGTKDELARQVTKAGMEIRRDLEAILTNDQAVVVGNDSTAPKMAGLPTFLRTNTDRGTNGTDPTLSGTTYGYPNAVGTDGTDRALSEATLLGVIEDIYTAGGEPDTLMMIPAVKQKFSQYQFGSSARIATPYQDHGKSPKGGLTVNGAVDIYVSDFGTFEVVPNRFQASEDVFILEKGKIGVAYLSKYEIDNQHKDGDADRKMLVTDCTLVVDDEASCGLVTDVDSTAAMTA